MQRPSCVVSFLLDHGGLRPSGRAWPRRPATGPDPFVAHIFCASVVPALTLAAGPFPSRQAFARPNYYYMGATRLAGCGDDYLRTAPTLGVPVTAGLNRTSPPSLLFASAP